METGLIKIRTGLTRQLVIKCEARFARFVRSAPKPATTLRMRDHFIIMKKLMKKKMKNAMIVRNYFEQKLISPVIEIMYMKKNKSSNVRIL